ncbi:MAG: DUF2267 domain-containing protein [Deltaproteobacteria bacterium]|nr:DUF2267 domain-containing protein [Deltaproteobacteria bacterium]
MRHDIFVERVLRHIKGSDRAAAERLTDATLGALGRRLSPDAAADLASWLPERLGRSVTASPHDEALEPEGAFALIAAEAGLELHQAVDLAPGVLATLAEALTEVQLTELWSELSPPWRELLSPARPAQASSHPSPGVPSESSLAGATPTRTSLADGKPGARRSIDGAGEPPAHSGSVARSPDPHSGTTLSSSHSAPKRDPGSR